MSGREITCERKEDMYTIELNEKGSRRLEISDANLETIRKYALFQGLAGSTGVVDETVLNRLKMTVRSLLEHGGDDTKDLLALCLDVVYHERMKPCGLRNLMTLYDSWTATHPATTDGEQNAATKA